MAKWYGKWGWGYYSSSYTWNDYSSYFDKWSKQYWLSEDRRKFKLDVRKEALNTYTPIDVRVVSSSTSIFKRNKMQVDINEQDLKYYNSPIKIKKLIEFYDKIPYNSDYIDGLITQQAVGWNLAPALIEKYKADSSINWSKIQNAIKDYDEGKITYAKLRELFRPLTSKEKCDMFADSDNMYKGWGNVWDKIPIDKDQYEKNKRIIQSKIKLRDIIDTEESFRKWKRINRNFINWSSLKPLMSKSIEGQKKKKIMFILDCSGSMEAWKSNNDPSYKAVSFVSACVNSWIFDISQVIYHSSWGWENCIEDIRKENLYNLYGGSEGFEKIDDNLNPDWVKSCDFAVCLTDLCIWGSAEQGLYDYLHKAKKHMVLSFQNNGTIKGMNVRTIDSPQSMVNALVSLTNN